MVMFQGELPFPIDVKGGENVVGRCVMTTGEVLVLPSMPKGEIVDRWLTLMSTQAAPGATTIFVDNFGMKIYGLLSPNPPYSILLEELFLLICGMPRSSSWFERIEVEFEDTVLLAKTSRGGEMTPPPKVFNI